MRKWVVILPCILVSAALAFIQSDIGRAALFLAGVCPAIIITLEDVKHLSFPVGHLMLGFALMGITYASFMPDELVPAIVGCIGEGGILLALSLTMKVLKKEPLGTGDILFAFYCGFATRELFLTHLVASIALNGVIAVLLLLFKRATMKTPIPYTIGFTISLILMLLSM